MDATGYSIQIGKKKKKKKTNELTFFLCYLTVRGAVEGDLFNLGLYNVRHLPLQQLEGSTILFKLRL